MSEDKIATISVNNAPLEKTLSPNLSSFLKDLFNRLNANVNYCVLRNYESILSRPGMDIDILSDAHGEICNITDELNAEYSLQLIKKSSKYYTSIFIIDINFDTQYRSWILIDVHSHYSHDGSNKLISAKALNDNDFKYNATYGIKTPTPYYEYITLLSHVALRNKIKPEYYTKLAVLTEKHGTEISKHILGDFKINKWVKHFNERSISSDMKSEVALMIEGISNKNFANSPGIKNKRGSIRKSISKIKQSVMNLLGKSSHRPWQLVLLGPDGVGKTTLSFKLKDYFSELPFCVSCHHHMKGELEEANPEDEGTNTSNKNISWKRKIRNSFETFLNNKDSKNIVSNSIRDFFNSIFTGIIDIRRERFYAKNWRSKLRNIGNPKRRISIVDRWYPISRRSRFAAYQNQPYYLHKFVELMGYGIQKPDLCVLLRDDPKEIIKRKQELTEGEMRRYQDYENKLIKNEGLDHIKLQFTFESEKLLTAIISKSLESMGNDVFKLIEAYDIARLKKQ